MNENEVKNETKNLGKKPIYKKWWFWVIIIIAIVGIGSSLNSGEKGSEQTTNKTISSSPKDSKNKNNASKDSNAKVADSKEKTIYDKNNILIKVKDYEYHSIMDYLEIKLYIENNSKQDLTFNMDGNVTLNDTSLDSYFYEDINKGTKKNVSINIHGLDENNIKEGDFSVLKFKLDIYNLDNFIKDDKIEEDFEFQYNF